MTHLPITMGTLKGHSLRTRRDLDYRPLPARLLHALFDRIGAELEGCRFLDGYAGTGIVGVYALSLGAVWAGFIERDRRIATLLRQNLRDLGLRSRTRVWIGPILRVLQRSPAAPFDWVFLGPPYETPNQELEQVLQRLQTSAWTRPGTRLIVQRFKKTPAPRAPGWEEERTPLQHGDNILYFFTRR